MIYSIKKTISIKNAIEKLSKFGVKSIVVLENSKLIGTLSDGDVRRSLLNNKKISDSINEIYNKDPIFFYEEDVSTEKVKKVFLEKKFDLIPVVTKNKKIKDVLYWNNVFKEKKKKIKKINNPLIIMAGGRGARLEPFTSVLPKPLIPVNNKPIIDHILEKFIDFGVYKIFISINYKSEILRSYFKEKKTLTKFNFITENKPLGTAGSLKLLKNRIKKDFFVTNCDVVFNINYRDFFDFHKNNSYDITIVASAEEHKIPYGVCNLNEEGNLKHIHEKPSIDFLANTGLYLCKPKVINLIPSNKYFNFTELIRKAIQKKYKVGVYLISNKNWIDVGHWKEYKKSIVKL